MCLMAFEFSNCANRKMTTRGLNHVFFFIVLLNLNHILSYSSVQVCSGPFD